MLRWDEAPAPYEVVFSTRVGGVSDGPYASLNLGLLTDDDRDRVEENRRRLFAAAGAHPERVAWTRQVHGARVVAADGRVVPADGVWTDEPGRALLVVAADCLPVALARVDGARPALALLHVGWRGLVGGVVAAGRAALAGRLVAAAVGPGIGPCCYEVRDDVAGPVRAAFGLGLVRDGRLDLPAAVERALRAAGVARVDRIGGCTACEPERFFSHRRDGGVTGRQGGLAVIPGGTA
ncbi:MAG: laccase domain-containing protein [Thermoleophilia bacterium]|nr:laccase domain-containing protein [Thermoleophilia bacterium]